MKIYTKRGDAGKTELFGGVKVSKADLRIQTYGVLDELNAALGWVLSERDLSQAVRDRLSKFQPVLFRLGAELATPAGKKLLSAPVETSEIESMEKEIDEMESQLPALKNFILPGGSRTSAGLHVARTICRRAERELAALHEAEPVRAEVLQYVNRLGDYLFVMARWVNQEQGIQDIPWHS